MKITVSKKALETGLGIVSRGIKNTATLPILKGILVTECAEGISLASTDLDIGIETTVEAMIEEGIGEDAFKDFIIADGKIFSEMVKKLPDGDITIEPNTNNIIVKCGKSQYTMLTAVAEEYPKLPDIKDGTVIEFESGVLKRIINETVYAVSEDITRPILTGVLFECKDGMMNVVALDAFRLTYTSCKVDSPDVKAIIPGTALTDIVKILGDGKAQMSITNNHCLIQTDNTKYTTRLLEGEYINYRQILPTEFKTTVSVYTETLAGAMGRAQLIAKDSKKSPVKLSIRDNNININASSESVGNINEDVECEIEGEGLEIAFNAGFILDALTHITTEKSTICFNSPVTPVIIKPTGADHDYINLVLPIRLMK